MKLQELIVYDDENYLVINKPSGLSTLEDRLEARNLLAVLRTTYPTAHVCHRLDKHTSGCILVALNDEAYRHAAKQFEAREVLKEYRALIEGNLEPGSHEVVAPIAYKSSGGARIDHRRGKASKTIVQVLETFRGFTLIACFPVTGRLHQIRIHLSDAGFPLVGDTAYGGSPFFLSSVKRKYKPSRHQERPIMSRVALHAHAIKITNLDGNPLTAEAPYPKDFRVLTEQLRKNAAGVQNN